MKTEIEDFDIAEMLGTPTARSEFLTDALASGDAGYLAHALGIIARAHGMSQLSRETSLPRATLYKALAEDGNPTAATLLRVIAACGMRLRVEPADDLASA